VQEWIALRAFTTYVKAATLRVRRCSEKETSLVRKRSREWLRGWIMRATRATLKLLSCDRRKRRTTGNNSMRRWKNETLGIKLPAPDRYSKAHLERFGGGLFRGLLGVACSPLA
jgi:hypothetical protein